MGYDGNQAQADKILRDQAGSCAQQPSKSGEKVEKSLIVYIRQYMPGVPDDELTLRLALVKARDYCAMLRGTTRHALAHSYACDGHEMAGEFVFAEVPRERLEIAIKYCRHIVQAAFLAEHLEGERVDR